MHIRIDRRHAENARRLRDLYLEDAVVLAVNGLHLAIRRAAAHVAALAAGRAGEARARGTPCRS